MKSRFNQAYDVLILQKPKSVLVILLLIFVFFVYHAKDFSLDASADSLLLENDSALSTFRMLQQRYPSNDLLIVTYTPTEELFSDTALDKLKSLRDELKLISGIDTILTILDAPLVKSSNVPLTEMINNIPTLEKPNVERGKASDELLNSPVYKNLIISEDGKTTALLLGLSKNVKFDLLLKKREKFRAKQQTAGLSSKEEQEFQTVNREYDRTYDELSYQRHLQIQEIRDTINKFRDNAIIHLGGVPMIADDMITFIQSDLIIFGTGVFVFFVIILTIIFRNLRWILLPLVSCFYSGLTMIGILGLIGWKVTVISSNFLALMLIITISMNIHLIVRYQQLSRDKPGESQLALVKATTNKLFKPCLYTALTTIMGFGSLVVSEIKPVIDFGWMMSAGLLVTFLTSFLLFPTLLILVGKKTSRQPPFSQRFVLPSYLAKLTQTRGNSILGLAIILAMASFIGISQLKVENSFINYFGKSTEIYQGLKLIDQKLGGTTPLEIIVKLQENPIEPLSPEDLEGMTEEEKRMELELAEEQANSPQYWFTPDKIRHIKKIHDYLDRQPEIGKVLSLASAVRVAENYAEEELDGMQLALLYKKLPKSVRKDLIDPYVSIKHNEARILTRVVDSNPKLKRKKLLETVESGLINKLGLQEKNVTINGLLVLYNNMLQSLFESQIKTIGVVMCGIAIMFLVLFKSVTLSIIGILPNLLGATVVLGGMGWANIPLDMMTITIAAITIGIAVDNGIHYIYRFKEEYALNQNYSETLNICHSNIGKAISYTTMTIIFGFSILVFSNFIPTIYFGVLTGMAMLIALLAALTVLPKLILLWKPFD